MVRALTELELIELTEGTIRCTEFLIVAVDLADSIISENRVWQERRRTQHQFASSGFPRIFLTQACCHWCEDRTGQLSLSASYRATTMKADQSEEVDRPPLTLKERIAALQQATATTQPRPPSGDGVTADAVVLQNTTSPSKISSTSLSVPAGQSSSSARSRSTSNASNQATYMAIYGGSNTTSPTKSRPVTPTIASTTSGDSVDDVIRSEPTKEAVSLSLAYPPLSPNSSRSTSPNQSRQVIADPLGIGGGDSAVSALERARAHSTSAAWSTDRGERNNRRTHLTATSASRDRSASTTAATSELRKLDVRTTSPQKRSPGTSPARPVFAPRAGAQFSAPSPGPSLPPRRATLASPPLTKSSALIGTADEPASPNSNGTAPRLPPRRSATQSSTTSSSSTLSTSTSLRSSASPALPPRPPIKNAILTPQNSSASAPGQPTTTGLNSIANNVQSRRRPMDPHAQRRYEALFDRAVRLVSSRPAWVKPAGEEAVVDSEVVKIIWMRSKLDNENLKRIWYVMSLTIAVLGSVMLMLCDWQGSNC